METNALFVLILQLIMHFIDVDMCAYAKNVPHRGKNGWKQEEEKKRKCCENAQCVDKKFWT